MSRFGGLSRAALARYECKYVVPWRRLPAVRDAIRPFVRPDHHAPPGELPRYAVCSLYFDADDLALCRQTLEGHKNRFKLRVRSYSDAANVPAFVEVKRRVDGVVLKSRHRLPRHRLAEFLAGEASADDGAARTGSDEFAALRDRLGAVPVLRVRYWREAYESAGGDPVRITFDTELAHRVTREPLLLHAAPRWHPTPVEGVILEVKFTETFPSWVADLVQLFELQKISVPKYCLSVEAARRQGHFAAAPWPDPEITGTDDRPVV